MIISFQKSRQAPQPGPVDHLTGLVMVKCLDRIQALTDEREQIQTKLQVRNMTLGDEIEHKQVWKDVLKIIFNSWAYMFRVS